MVLQETLCVKKRGEELGCYRAHRTSFEPQGPLVEPDFRVSITDVCVCVFLHLSEV